MSGWCAGWLSVYIYKYVFAYIGQTRADGQCSAVATPPGLAKRRRDVRLAEVDGDVGSERAAREFDGNGHNDHQLIRIRNVQFFNLALSAVELKAATTLTLLSHHTTHAHDIPPTNGKIRIKL